ncbi:MAG TPA: polymer-forming cytoskeletal protein [Aestuariivirga sp.]|jgi:cytoskeletal protein CcmA (bactofilin family)|nr:polymer-forming cytoskeletal protein [Aestuariivirga sp.]
MFFRRARHNNDNSQEYSGPSIIAHDLTIDGNVVLSGELHVDGTIKGTVQAGCCVIEANGVISGSCEADEVHVYGQIFGPVTARHVHVYPGGRVEGDIYNETVSIESGAFIQGAIHHSDPSQWVAEDLPAEPEPLPPMPFEQQAREAVNSFGMGVRHDESALRRSMAMQENPLGNIQPIRVIRPR